MCIRIWTTRIENNSLTPKSYKLVTRAYVLNVHVFCWANHIHHSLFGGRDINGYHMTWKCHSPRTKKKVKHPLIYWIITRYHEFSLEANIDFNKTCEKMGSYSCEGQVRYREPCLPWIIQISVCPPFKFGYFGSQCNVRCFEKCIHSLWKWYEGEYRRRKDGK